MGGGTSLCLLRNMGDAYKIQALQGTRLSAWKALHAATLGAAEGLGLAHEIGRIEPGCMADLTVWDWAVGELAQHRDALACERLDGASASLHARVFAWMTLGDERNLVATWVAGRAVFQRGATGA